MAMETLIIPFKRTDFKLFRQYATGVSIIYRL